MAIITRLNLAQGQNCVRDKKVYHYMAKAGCIYLFVEIMLNSESIKKTLNSQNLARKESQDHIFLQEEIFNVFFSCQIFS